MLHVLAAEGGYQEFELGSTEKLWLYFSLATALLAIGVGFYLRRSVLAEDKGTAKMQEIATAIQEGALAYLKRQFKTILVILVPLAVIVFFTSTKVLKPDGTEALSFGQSGIYRTLAFIAGCIMAWGASTVNSWYKNEHGRVAQNWPFTLLEYWQRTLAPDPDDYVVT